MKKRSIKTLGALAIITALFVSIFIFTNQQVPAKSNDQKGEKAIEKLAIKQAILDEEVLETAFKASEGELEGTAISIWSQIKGKVYTIEEMEEITLECANLLNLEKNAEIESTNEETYNKVIITNQKQDEIYFTTFMESFKKEGMATESYLSVDLYLSEQYNDLTKIKDKVLSYFEEHGFNYEYSITMIGTFPNKMNTDIMKEVINKTFYSADGQVIEGMEETEYGGMVSLTGYSEKLQNNIQLAGDQINLNVAMRYSNYDDKTYIWIGTPLIATEY